jgi:hypothetical protein
MSMILLYEPSPLVATDSMVAMSVIGSLLRVVVVVASILERAGNANVMGSRMLRRDR